MYCRKRSVWSTARAAAFIPPSPAAAAVTAATITAAAVAVAVTTITTTTAVGALLFNYVFFDRYFRGNWNYHEELIKIVFYYNYLFVIIVAFFFVLYSHYMMNSNFWKIFHHPLFLTEGTHDELLASALKGESAGIYANLWNMQLQHRDSTSIVSTPIADNEEIEIKLVWC